MKPREEAIERYFVAQVEKAGGEAEKFVSPGRKNVPDRLVACRRPNTVHFVELKRPGEKPTPGQLRDHARRRARGFKVFVIDSHEGVDRYIREDFE